MSTNRVYLPEHLLSVPLLQAENQFFGADYDYALEFGGDITREFLKALPESWYTDLILDSRCHMLMPGWYPAIPGWHLDDIPRDKSGQPDLNDSRPPALHMAAIVDCGTGSLTEFCRPITELPRKVAAGSRLWGVHDQLINHENPPREAVENLEVFPFTVGNYHRATPARHSGWRFFIRASVQSTRQHQNVIRTQTQVYMPAIGAGW